MPTTSTDPATRVYFALVDALKADPVLRDEISPGNWITYEGTSAVPPRVQTLTQGGRGSTLPSDFPYVWIRPGNSDTTLGGRTETFGRKCYTEFNVEHFLITVTYDDLRADQSLPIETAIKGVLNRAWVNRLGLTGVVGTIDKVNKTTAESGKRFEAQGSFRRVTTWDVPVRLVINHT